jgi:hypothetical protein
MHDTAVTIKQVQAVNSQPTIVGTVWDEATTDISSVLTFQARIKVEVKRRAVTREKSLAIHRWLVLSNHVHSAMAMIAVIA